MENEDLDQQDPLALHIGTILPDATPDELQTHANELRTRAPGVPDDQLIQAASGVQQDAADRQTSNSYIKNKFGLGDQYSPEARQALVDKNKEDASGPNWLAGLGALGAGIAGRDAIGAGQAILGQQKAQREGKLNEFDKSKAFAMQNMIDRQKQEKMARENDPNSDESKLAQGLFIKMKGDPAVASTLTAAKFKDFSEPLKTTYEIAERAKAKEFEVAQRSADRDQDRQAKAQQYALQRDDQQLRRDEVNSRKDEALAKKAADEAFKKTTEGKLTHLNASDKARFDSAKMGYQAIDNMNQALAKGDNTFSLIGDNDFTQASTLFEEALGRMQSGGAINHDEAARFRKMRPTVSDSSEMQKKKLLTLQNEMGSRLKTLGFQPEELGLAAIPKEKKSKQVVKKFVSPSTGKTKVVYNDGTEEIKDMAVASDE